jgi:VWFA-related protein
MSGPRFFIDARARRFAWRLFLIFLVCLYGVRAESQEPQKGEAQKGEAQKGQDEVVTLKARLITTDVMVKDKKGRYITDLKAEDFTIFENGVRQRVEFFDPPLAVPNEAAQPNAAQPNAAQPDAVKPNAARAVAETGRPMNIISLVVDGITTDLADMKQVREGLTKYIRERIADTDTVAIFAVGSGLQLLQPFTQDKAKLLSAVEKAYSATTSSKNLERSDIEAEIGQLREVLRNSEGNPSPQAQLQVMMANRALERFILLRAQLGLQTARPILAALAAVCDAQRAIPGKKTVVLFSQGFVASSILDWQVQSTINIANRANVAIYIIDSAGLAAGASSSGAIVPASPLGGIAAPGSSEERIRAVGGENVFDRARHEGMNRQQDILYRISGDTGGEFIKGNNDIARGLNRIDQEIRSRYTLAYYSSDPNFDGGFRKMRVEVGRPDDAKVSARAGYYATAGEEIVPLSAEDRKLLASFAAAEAKPALPFFVETTPFRTQRGRYVVPLSIEVPPSAVRFDRKGDRHEMQLDVLGVIREGPDRILSRLGGNFDIGLAAEQYQSILTNNIFYRQDIELAPGTYDIELIIRDRLSGKMAAKKEKLVLPGADTEFSTSAVVLSRHVEAAKTAPGSGQGDVLSHGGIQIRPLPSREFRAKDNLIIFFELYNAPPTAETGKPFVKVSVTLVKDGKAARKPIDYVLADALTEQAPRMIFAKYINLAGLEAGKYTAMIEARDMVTRKLVTQQASFVILQ